MTLISRNSLGRILPAAIAALGLAMSASSAQAAEGAAAETAKPVTASLVADAEAVQPGATVTLGVLFKIAPGWHIYWRNPGETGFASEVQWTVPGGAAAVTRYPAPISFVSPGDLVSYGYENEVLLLTEVTVPSDAQGQVKFEAKARWLMCSDRCVPGKDTLTLSLPVGGKKPANEELFARYRALLPKTYAPGTWPAGVSGSLRPVAGGVEASVLADPTAGKIVGEDRSTDGLRRLYFFPYLPTKDSGAVLSASQIPPPDGTASTPAGQVKVYTKPATITAKSEGGSATKPAPAAVNGVLVLQRLSADGKPQPAEFADITVK